MRTKYTKQLDELNNELITMGAMCEEAIENSVKYLLDKSDNIREDVVETEKQINQKERDIETLCMKLLMQQQPVAGDLRIISSALKIISDMERIGDQAFDIAEIAVHVLPEGIQSKTHIEEMARATIKMVSGSVDSFVKKDVEKAYDVIKLDDTVDGLFDKVKKELIHAIETNNDEAETLVDMVMIAKYFERIGDHAENIAQWVIYYVTGNRT